MGPDGPLGQPDGFGDLFVGQAGFDEGGDVLAGLVALGLEGDVEEFGEGAAGFVAVALDAVETEDFDNVGGDD